MEYFVELVESIIINNKQTIKEGSRGIILGPNNLNLNIDYKNINQCFIIRTLYIFANYQHTNDLEELNSFVKNFNNPLITQIVESFKNIEDGYMVKFENIIVENVSPKIFKVFPFSEHFY